MNFFILLLPLTIGILFWLLDSLWSISGRQFLANFFFAGGLHPGEQYIYIVVLSIVNLVAVAYSFFNKEKFIVKLPLLILIFFNIAATISTFFFSVDKFESMREFWIYILLLGLLIYIYNFVYNHKDKEEFLYNYCLGLLTIFIVSILIAVIVSLGLPSGSPWLSLFYQKNAYGGFVLLFIPISFALFVFSMIYKDYMKSILFFIAFVFGIFTLIFTASKASFLSLIISLPLYLGYFRIIKIDQINLEKKTKNLFLATSITSFILLFLQLAIDKKFTQSLVNSLKTVIFTLTNTIISRVDFYEASLKIARDFPFGCGFYNFSKVYPVYQSSFYFYSKDPHNYYLKILSEIGYIGFFLFIILILYFLYKSFNLHKKVDLDLVKSEEYKQNIDKDIKEIPEEFKKRLSKLGIYILSSGLSIGLIQSLIHIAFDVDLKFSYILIIFLINLFVNLAIIDSIDSNKESKLEKLPWKPIWIILFSIISMYGLIFGVKEAIAYKEDKEIEKKLDYKKYLELIKNSYPSSSKYVTLAELYRVDSKFEESVKANLQAIKLCKYNINAYLSLAYLYSDKIETLNSIKESPLKTKIEQKVNYLAKDLRKIVFEAFKYDNKNYPDLHLLLAQSYEYTNSKNYKKLYKNIFLVVYPLNEYIQLMDIRYTTFGDVIAQSYMKYLMDDFIKCQSQNNNILCEKVCSYLYDPLIKYNLKTTIDDFYLFGILSFYVTAKKSINSSDYKHYFLITSKLLENLYTTDFIYLYYYTSCQVYLENYNVALELARIINNFPFYDNLKEDQKEKLKLAKINNYSILAYLYNKKNLPNLSKEFLKLHEKFTQKQK